MSERLTLQDLVDLLSDKQNITKKDAETFLRELVALISETIEQKDFVRIKDFGTFKLTPVNARRSVDVNTGDPIEIPAHYKLSFTPDKVLREGVNRPFSHFESILLADDEVAFEDKATADNKQEAPKKVEVKAEQKKASPEVVESPKVVAPVVKKAEPEIVAPITKKEEEITSNKVDEVLSNTPDALVIEKEVLTEADLQREEELADINSFLTKEIEEKKEVKPLVTSSDSSVKKERVSPSPRVSRQYDEDDDYVDYDQLAQQKKKRNVWIGVGVFILLLLGVGIWGYDNFMVEKDFIPYAQDNSKIIISEETKPALAEQPTAGVDSEPIAEEPKIEEVAPVVEQPVVTPPVAAQPEQGAKEIEVKSGQTMRVLGMEYFGHGAFWVYIFEENRGKISRPDAVFAGMKLTIPPASKYDIDPNDELSVKKAKKLEMKLFGEFSDK